MKTNRFTKQIVAISLTGLISSVAAAAPLCSSWSIPEDKGRLDNSVQDETSGMALSRVYPRFYMNNDSGDGPNLYVVDEKTLQPKKVSIQNYDPRDAEDLSLGPCPKSEETCIAIADIGDNSRKRSTIEIVFVKETATFKSSVAPVAHITAQYPDRAHNAEAFALLPNGEFLIVTKEDGGKAGAATVFRGRTDVDGQTLEKIGTIDVPAITKDNLLGGIVTGMSASADGRKLLLLTYVNAIELSFDPSAKTLPTTQELAARGEIRLVKINVLPQQEAITYDRNDLDFYYTTEAERSFLIKKSKAPVLKVQCLK